MRAVCNSRIEAYMNIVQMSARVWTSAFELTIAVPLKNEYEIDDYKTTQQTVFVLSR